MIRAAHQNRDSCLLSMLGIVLAIGLASASQDAVTSPARDSPVEAGPERGNQPTHDEQIRTNEALRSVAAELRAIREQAAEAERKRACRDSRPGEPIWSNWVLIVVTGAAVIAAFMSLGALKKQVNAGLIAAKAAQASAKVAERHMYFSLRARMGLKQVIAQNFAQEAESTIHVVFQNFGGKGAYILEHCIEMSVNALPEKPSLDTFKIAANPVEAGAEFTVIKVIRPSITPEMWRAINDEGGTVRLHVYGAVRYRAGFGTSPKTLAFCRAYDPLITRLSGSKSAIFTTAGGPAYNYAE